jgi:hypothetical protein
MSQKTINVTEEELQLILEALLFTSCVDANHEGYAEDMKKMIGLAFSLRHQNQSVYLKNIFVFEDTKKQWEESTSEVIKFFPEILKTN